MLGEDEGLDEDLRDAFRTSGLYHLLAVSGQNVALVAGGVLLAAWLLGIPRMAGQVGALAAIGAYVLAVGAQPSVVRAGVAGGLASLAWMCARERDRWWFLLLGALVLLAWNPYNLLDVGFQLSFAAVAAIFTLVPRLMRWLEGYPLPRAAAAVVAVSIACGVATLRHPPLPVRHGARVLRDRQRWRRPSSRRCSGSACWRQPSTRSSPTSLRCSSGWTAGSRRISCSAPGRSPRFPTRSLPQRVLLLTAGLVAFIALGRGSRSLAVAVAAAGLIAIAWRAAPDPVPPPPTGLRVTFLDVGQGDATLIQVPRGALLVDQGHPRRT